MLDCTSDALYTGSFPQGNDLIPRSSLCVITLPILSVVGDCVLVASFLRDLFLASPAQHTGNNTLASGRACKTSAQYTACVNQHTTIKRPQNICEQACEKCRPKRNTHSHVIYQNFAGMHCAHHATTGKHSCKQKL